MSPADGTTLGGKRSIDVLHDAHINKSTTFTQADREAPSLTGLLLSAVDNEEMQVRRDAAVGAKPTDLERYIYLIGCPIPTRRCSTRW